MKRIEQVERCLKKASSSGLTAKDIALSLGASRANISSDLNQLCREGRATKSGTRPVYYHPVLSPIQEDPTPCPGDSSNAEDPFAMMALRFPSMYHCVEQAKAAALYPPHGMNMLIRGATGVGKTTFARLIYDYAVCSHVLSSSSPFVTFNCADYADNPQLLVSQLMGTVKGAYTGAEEDREGLLSQADGGILFLDEVHRLPPQGQEMLFTFIDRGVYRRLGESAAEHRAQVMLICATTEDPSSALLRTFTRRIPMVIEIPALCERSRKERFSLIAGFFLEESRRLEMPLYISVNSIRGLLSYSCPSNVGQLESDIKLLCAGAYSRLQGRQCGRMEVTGRFLPDNIREGMYTSTSREEVWLPYISANRRFCVFDAKTMPSTAIMPAKYPFNQHASIYDAIDRRYAALSQQGCSETEINDAIAETIHKYFSDYTNETSSASIRFAENVIDPKALQVADEILSLASKSLERRFSDSIRFGLAAHISGALSRAKHGLPIRNSQLDEIRRRHPREFSAALTGLKTIQNHYSTDLPLDEAGFLALFLMPFERHHASIPLIVVIAHGSATATSMVETANYLQGADLAVGLNASLKETPSQVYSRFVSLVRDHMPQAGILLMIDMGSLSEFGESLTKDTGIPCKVLPLVSTMHIVEAERKASLGYPLDDVYKAAVSVNEILGPHLPVEALKASPAAYQVSKAFIVTVCTTSEGGAQMMKEIFDTRLNYHNGFCETIALVLHSQDDIRERLDALSKTGIVLCGASTFTIDYSIPWYSPTDVIAGNAIQEIQETIEEALVISKTQDTLSDLISSYPVRAAFPAYLEAIRNIQEASGRHLNADTKVGVLCHLAYLVDRIKSDGSVPLKTASGHADKNSALYIAIMSNLHHMEQQLGIAIPQEEAEHIYAFFSEENCRQS